MFLGWALFPTISPGESSASRYNFQGWSILATEHGLNNNKICGKAVWHVVLNLGLQPMSASWLFVCTSLRPLKEP